MYLYFNKQGVLKEIVNDEAIRQGNSNINKIKFFIEGAEPQIVDNVYKALTFITGVRTFIDVNGNPIETVDIDNNQTTTEQFSLETEELEIPYNKKRELHFFKYFTKYEMFSITVPDDVLNINGTVGCRIQMVGAEGIITLGLIVFNVEGTGTDAVISPDTAINIAQWNYLISNMLTPEKYVVKYDENAYEWDVVPTENSHKPVTSGGIYTAIANALSVVYKIMGSSDVSSLNDLTKSIDMNGYVYNCLDAGTLTNEDSTTVSVQVGDNVVFVWNNGSWYWDRLAGIIDTSNLVTLNTDQTITGIKTLPQTKQLRFECGATPTQYKMAISSDSNYGLVIGRYTSNGDTLQGGIIVTKDNLVPTGSGINLGSSTNKWNEAYFSGNAYYDNGIEVRFAALATDKYFYIKANGNEFHIGAYGIATALILDAYLTNFSPTSATQNLGQASKKWNYVYANYISDGTNSIAVESIGKKLYKHTITSGGSDFLSKSLIIISTNGTGAEDVQGVDDLMSSGYVNAYIITLVGQYAVVSYELTTSTSCTLKSLSILGNNISVVTSVLNDSDIVTDIVEEL